MKRNFFPRLAWSGMRSNRRLYLPYLLTASLMIAMHYIVNFLSACGALDVLPGAEVMQSMLYLGGWMIAIFSCLFLMYSNSFLMRRRRMEFGLYNMLGMGKRHLRILLCWETLFTALISISAGLFLGVALSKAAELFMVNMMGGEVSYRLMLMPYELLLAAGVFAAIFALILLRELWQIRKSSAVALLKSENTGERLPRLYGLWGVLGTILLAAAYFIAVSIEDPMSALVLFFVAVILVILGTYLLFASGSVLLCKLLKKNRRYYYKANHFVSVSSMAYRMTRNGAGLASICILLTMVLVMLSSTSCLYFGVDDALNNRYVRDFTLEAAGDDANDLRASIEDTLRSLGIEAQNLIDYRVVRGYGQLTGERGDHLQDDSAQMSIDSVSIYENVRMLEFIPLEDYNRMTGVHYVLDSDEALLYSPRTPYKSDTLTLSDGYTLQIRAVLDTFPVGDDSSANVVSTLYLAVPDIEAVLARTGVEPDVKWIYGFDTAVSAEEQLTLHQALKAALDDRVRLECRESERADFTGTFAGFFTLGITLSIVFILAAVLIIYYKQITEGYEDQRRFAIMQKVGMTHRDIRRSVNSQLLTVFLLPPAGAGVHLCFVFPMIRLLLMMFNMNNLSLFVRTTLISYVLFFLLYIAVYQITSNAYYSIVSGTGRGEADRI